MKKDDISRMLQRYISAKEEGKEPYFDADQIEDLLDNLELENDYTYFDELLALGLKLHPGNQGLLVKKCRQLISEEKYEKAMKILEGINDPGNIDVVTLRLECYCYTNQFSTVWAITKDLIQNNADVVGVEEVFEDIAPLLNDLDMLEEAREYVNLGLSLYPDNQVLKSELCYILEADEEVDKAITLCNELIDENPFSYEHWFMLGRLYSMSNEYEKAIDAFDFALTCDDSDPELKILKAYCLYMNESYENAIETYQEINANEEEKLRITPLIAECYIKMEEYEKAYQLLKPIINEPELEDKPTNYINYIRCCSETEREKEAVMMLFKGASLYPDDIRILSLVVLVLLNNGNKEEAVAITNRIFKLLEATPDNFSSDDDECGHLIQTGKYFFAQGDVDKAIDYYQKALKLHPNAPSIHIHLAMAYLDKQDEDNCLKHIEQISGDDMAHYLQEIKGFWSENDKTKLRHIDPQDLAKEYLKNKENKN